MSFLYRVLRTLSAAASFLLLLACSQANESNSTVGRQMTKADQSALQHSFECSAPDLARGLVKTIQFDGERASEESEPYVGAFSATAITFKMQKGIEQAIKLNDPIFFDSEKQGRHDGCAKFTWNKAGPLVFVVFWGIGGNPYQPQQILFLDETSQVLLPLERLHPLVGRDFVDFEKGNCLAELRHGDGLVMRTCFQDSVLALKNVLLEDRYQSNAWHTFLCVFSDDRVDIAEYRVKSSALDETPELDPPGSRQKMLSACDLFLKRFNEQVTLREGSRSAT